MKKKKLKKVQISQGFVNAFNNASNNDINKVEEVTSLDKSFTEEDNINEDLFNQEELPHRIY